VLERNGLLIEFDEMEKERVERERERKEMERERERERGEMERERGMLQRLAAEEGGRRSAGAALRISNKRGDGVENFDINGDGDAGTVGGKRVANVVDLRGEVEASDVAVIPGDCAPQRRHVSPENDGVLSCVGNGVVGSVGGGRRSLSECVKAAVYVWLLTCRGRLMRAVGRQEARGRGREVGGDYVAGGGGGTGMSDLETVAKVGAGSGVLLLGVAAGAVTVAGLRSMMAARRRQRV
jgi:hypothetical protein